MNVYIGPYAKWLNPIIEKEIDCCGNPNNCPNPTKGFCPQCGLNMSRRFIKTRVEKIKINIDTLIDRSLHNFYSHGGSTIFLGVNKQEYELDVYIPNIEITGYEKYTFSDNDDKDYENFDLTNFGIIEAMEWFKSSFSNELKKLEEQYESPPLYSFGYFKMQD